jgi:hypothetical protein
MTKTYKYKQVWRFCVGGLCPRRGNTHTLQAKSQ